MPDTFAKEFQLLRSKYISNLEARENQIRELWGMLRHLKWSDHGVRVLQQLAHQLAGSGDTFGFPDISKAAKELETYLVEHQNPAQHIGGVERKVIDERIHTLSTALLNASQHPQDIPETSPLNRSPVVQGHSKKVFIVDDDTALSALLAVYLRNAGFIATTFESPADCLQQLEQEIPDIILMDLIFPTNGNLGSNTAGILAIQEIHQRVGSALPVILISSRTDLSARLQALRAGGAHYITKPINFPTLISTLLTTMEQHEPIRRVMIVDDEEAVAEYHAGILRTHGMDVLCVTQAMQSFQRAAQFKPELVILDMHMPDINGMELATLLRQEQAFSLLPIIFLTADHSEQLHQKIRALGVNALLTKPVDAKAFVGQCKRAIRDAQQLKSRIEHITRKSDDHQVTRHYLFSAIDDELQRSQTSAQPAAVYYISADQLDELNQHYGHVGIAQLHDAFCQHLAGFIGSQEQWSAIANLTACVLVSQRSAEHHQQRAAQIIRHLTSRIYQTQQESKTLRISLGIVYLSNADVGVNDVIQQAEAACEAARVSGGNCARLYEPGLSQAREQLPTDKTLATSVEPSAIAITEPEIVINDQLPNDKLALSYQPVINLENKDINHYDVLVRWRRDDGELISAAKFLHRIENPKLLVELDRWILQTAVNAMGADGSTRESATLFLHLSAQTLQQKIFFSFAANLMRNARLRGSRRVVFILEEAWVNADQEAAALLIKALHDAQCGVCLSRAGESLNAAHLIQTLAFDYVRLSPSLTSKASGQQAIIEQLVSAARVHKSRLIATQVEDSQHLGSLWEAGVTLFQGFFIQPPGSVFHKKNELAYNKEHEI